MVLTFDSCGFLISPSYLKFAQLLNANSVLKNSFLIFLICLFLKKNF